MRPWLAVLVVGLVLLGSDQSPAQVDKAAVGTLFIHATDAARTVTITRNGSVLAALTLPRGTIASAVDEHRHPVREGERYQFHGHFELRAMTPGDMDLTRASLTAAAELLASAPMVITAEGV